MWTLNVAETASRPLVAPHAHALNSTYAWRKTRGRGQTKPLKAIYADSLVQGACMKWHAGFLTDYLKCHASFLMSWHTWEVSELPLSKANYNYLSEEILFYFTKAAMYQLENTAWVLLSRGDWRIGGKTKNKFKSHSNCFFQSSQNSVCFKLWLKCNIQ